jgi:hypothetical protein
MASADQVNQTLAELREYAQSQGYSSSEGRQMVVSVATAQALMFIASELGEIEQHLGAIRRELADRAT